MKSMFRQKLLPGVLSVLILLPTVLGLSIYRSNAQKNFESIYRPLNEQAYEYVQRYNQVRVDLELERIQYEYYSKFGKSMTMLIIQTCRDNLYDSVYMKAARSYKVSGIFTVTDDECVGLEGCIDKEQCETLVKAGWKIALALPKDVPKDFDLGGYIDRVAAQLKSQGIEFPTAFVFGRENYSKELYESIAAMNRFEAIAYNALDENCDLTAKPMKSSGDVLFIPYLYTSKRTPIRTNFEKALKRGECLSISTGGAESGMSGETATRDTTVGSLKDIIETIKNRNNFYRKYADYRSERLKSDTEYAEELRRITNKISELKAEKERLNTQILNVYAVE